MNVVAPGLDDGSREEGRVGGGGGAGAWRVRFSVGEKRTWQLAWRRLGPARLALLAALNCQVKSRQGSVRSRRSAAKPRQDGSNPIQLRLALDRGK